MQIYNFFINILMLSLFYYDGIVRNHSSIVHDLLLSYPAIKLCNALRIIPLLPCASDLVHPAHPDVFALRISTVLPCAGQSCYPAQGRRVTLRRVNGLRCAGQKVIHIQGDISLLEYLGCYLNKSSNVISFCTMLEYLFFTNP